MSAAVFVNCVWPGWEVMHQLTISCFVDLLLVTFEIALNLEPCTTIQEVCFTAEQHSLCYARLFFALGLLASRSATEDFRQLT
jgi:hypothetical protein